MNEKGSSLLLVLLVTLVFSVLGLSILGAAVNNTKRTEIRALEVESTASSKAVMSEVLAKLQENLDPQPISNNNAKKIKEILTAYETPYNASGNGLNYDNELQTIINKTVSHFNDYVNYTIAMKELSLHGDSINNEKGYKDYLGDISLTDFNNFKDNNFMRIIQITVTAIGDSTTINRNVKQNVILSPTPSFLNYAVGSKEVVRINGSPDIIGNVYAPTLELHSKARYIKEEEEDYSGDFQGPSIFGNLYTQKLLNERALKEPANISPFFDGDFNEKDDGISGIPAIKSTISNFVDMDFDETFYLKWAESGAPELPKLTTGLAKYPKYELNCSEDDDFFKALEELDAFVENNRQLSGSFDDVEVFITEDTKVKTEGNKRYLNPKFTCKDNKEIKRLYLIEESMLETYRGHTDNLFKEDVEDTTNTIFFTNIDRYDPDDPSGTNLRLLNTYTKNKDSSIPEERETRPNFLKIGGHQDLLLKDGNNKGWLVVNGSLEINGSKEESTAPTIKGNILVNGDLYIRSSNAEDPDDTKEYLKFDATIYVRGKTIIDNVNIEGADGKQLVIISNEELSIMRVNEYENISNEKSLKNLINDPPNLKGFFYTNKTATLYGVGSHFQIEGGVFAHEQLTINAIRYNFLSDGLNAIDEVKLADYNSNKGLRSRFFVEYDNRVITDQLSSLPRVDRLQMIVDNLNIE